MHTVLCRYTREKSGASIVMCLGVKEPGMGLGDGLAGKCLSCEHRDLNLAPQYPYEKLNVTLQVCPSVPGR